jgi:hypothetical protein
VTSTFLAGPTSERNRSAKEKGSMSVGFFVGPIRSSYIDEAQDIAAACAAKIDTVLKQNGLPGYGEPSGPPDVYDGGLFGRSALDHHSPSAVAELGEMAASRGDAPHTALLAANPYRVVFVPVDFEVPLLTGHSERIAGEQVEIWLAAR